MSALPDKQLLRRGEVMAYLGVSGEVMTKLVSAGTLELMHLAHDQKGRPVGRGYFLRSQVQAVATGLRWSGESKTVRSAELNGKAPGGAANGKRI